MDQQPAPANKVYPTKTVPQSLSWETLEFQEYQKHPLWFGGVALVTGLLVLYAIFTKSWSTAVVFMLAGILSIIYASQKPQQITITLTGSGIEVGNLKYFYTDLVKFWIVYHPPVAKVLYIETKSLLNRTLKIELGNQDPLAVREFLQTVLPEDLDEQESLADIIARKLKF